MYATFEEEKLTQCFVFCFLFFLDLWAGNNNNNKKKKKKKKWATVTICTVVAIVVMQIPWPCTVHEEGDGRDSPNSVQI